MWDKGVLYCSSSTQLINPGCSCNTAAVWYANIASEKFFLQKMGNRPCITDMHITVCFKIVIKCKISIHWRFKFKNFQVLLSTLSVFKHIQGPWIFFQNSSIFKNFSNSLWTLTEKTTKQKETKLTKKSSRHVSLLSAKPWPNFQIVNKWLNRTPSKHSDYSMQTHKHQNNVIITLCMYTTT